MVQYAGFLLDRLIAPELSGLTSFSLPDVPVLPNYYGSFFLNNMFRSEIEDNARPLIFALLRHLAQATREYRAGSKSLVEFGDAQLHSSEAIKQYLSALTHFEQAIIHCDLAVGLSHAIARCIDNNTPKLHFTLGEDTPGERLRFLCNALKHFNGTIVEGHLSDHVAPVWIVTEGLKCIVEQKSDKQPTMKTLKFKEMADILGDLAKNAEFLAEGVFHLIRERQATKSEAIA